MGVVPVVFGSGKRCDDRCWRCAPEQAVNWEETPQDRMANERRGSGLVGGDREALRVCDRGPVLRERADLAADDDG